MTMPILVGSMPQQHQPPWNGSQLSLSSSQSGSINLSGSSGGGVDLRGLLGQAGASGQMSQQQQHLLLQLVGTMQQQLPAQPGLALPPPPPPSQPSQQQQYQDAFSFALSSLLGSGGGNPLFPQKLQHPLNLTMAAAQPPPSSVLNHPGSNLNSALFHNGCGGGNGVIGGINNGSSGVDDILSILLNCVSLPQQQQAQQQSQQLQRAHQELQQAQQQQQLQQAQQQARGRRRQRRSRQREEWRRRQQRGREQEGWWGRRQRILLLRAVVVLTTASAIVDTRALPRHSRCLKEGCIKRRGQCGEQERLEAVLVVVGGSKRIVGICGRERTSFLGNDRQASRCAG